MQGSVSMVPTETLVFRYGRDMAPEAIAAETPGARFVARARLLDGEATGIAGPAGPSGEVWGILLIQPEAPVRQGDADVITDEGRVTHATILTDAGALEDLGAVVTQARYWELAPSYIEVLDQRRAAG
ncbi:MAG: hypothetical protein AVDCRST_MAG33-1630 [uncultured Thermomicrobiales bacterium]|uniref:Uncharacterized protein n=1 Tax=uncultured Thermomicrobiales bacterium TaxID=1645740 RepID=A0A6J4UZB3_9BACT|nr:MAG: hypothetical protein AVDCRST_MAG33-1630 [uncultured Thermomicrobiales bacterium]